MFMRRYWILLVYFLGFYVKADLIPEVDSPGNLYIITSPFRPARSLVSESLEEYKNWTRLVMTSENVGGFCGFCSTADTCTASV